MKRSAIVLLAAAASAAPAFSQSQVSLSGVVDLALRHSTNSVGSIDSLASGSNSTSRLIFRGSEDLGGGLKANIWLEGSFAADTGVFGTGNQFFDRQSTAGLQGNFGEVRAGRTWNPVFLSWAGTDPFVVTGVGAANTMIATASTAALSRAFGAGATTLSRSSNAVEYVSPDSWGGVYVNALTAFGEKDNAGGNFNYRGARLGYQGKSANVAVYWGDTRIDATGGHFKQVGLRGAYDFGVVNLSASVTDSAYLTSKHRLWILGAAVPVGSGVIKLSYVKADQRGRDANGASIDANDASLVAVGYVHYLSKRTVLYANVAHVKNQGRATYAIAGGPAGVAPGSSSSGYELGMRHAF